MFQILVETNKGTRVAEVFCSADSCSIGKDPDNLITLHGWKVGKVHAKLLKTHNGLFVVDQGSRMGTRVNGSIVNEFGPLSEADIIEIHDYRIRIKSNHPTAKLAANDMARPLMGAAANDQLRVNRPDQRIAPSIVAAPQPPKPVETVRQQADKLPSIPEGAELTPQQIEQDRRMREYRMLVRERLLQQMDLRRININDMSDLELREVTGRFIREIIAGIRDIHPSINPEELAEQVLAESVGLGPLEVLVARDDISEIMVNSAQEIFYEQRGRIYKSTVTFTDDKAVQAAIERIVVPLGRRIDESSPMVDARLKDGSRVNAVIPPLALKGPCLTIRKFSKEKLTSKHLIGFGSMDERMVHFLEMAVEHKRNIVISGGTGSGKTTLLNVLSGFIPPDERIITVEDAAELRLYQPNLVSLEARPPNQEGKGAVHIRDLVRNCLRMRPDRIVIGECRGGEALDMLQAMNTGHDGSLTTAHANNPRDCISRIEVMVMMAGMDLPAQAIREQIASAIHLIVQQTRFSCGSRKVTSISEIAGLESGRIQLSEIFRFNQQGYDKDGRVKGTFDATGLVPEFYSDLVRRGIDVDVKLFNKPNH
jgi:pilus assembly protein CpaF